MKEKLAKTFWQQLRGLMFVKKKDFDYALIFKLKKETKWFASIHTLFVFFPIEVFWLNNKNMVVDVKIVKSFSLFVMPKQPASIIVEMPMGYKNV